MRRRRATAKASPGEIRASADSEFVHASHDFLHSWLVADNFDHAATYFSEQSDSCVLAYLPPDKAAPSSSPDYAAYLRSVITSVGNFILSHDPSRNPCCPRPCGDIKIAHPIRSS